MKTHALSHHYPIAQPSARRAPARLYRFIVDRFLLLPIGALLALVWANTAAESYFRFSFALSFAVNEIAMAFFLALIAQEVLEAMLPHGALHSWRRWGMPLVAAGGGILGAAGVYLAYVSLKYEAVLAPAWPIACAVDIAAAYYVIKTIWHRSSALPFLLLLAVATDAVGLVVVAFRAPVIDFQPGGPLLMVAALGTAALLRRRKVRRFWPYVAISGTLSWFALYWQGIHPALALVPIVPFLPHEARSLEVFADLPDDDAVRRGEHEWNELVQIVLFLFGLVNAGVILRGYGTGTWAVLAAALVGRPLGILVAVALASSAGLHLPRRIGWRELVVIALATSSGFTFALFFATGLLPIGPILGEIKLGALATVAAAGLAIAAARIFELGVFGRRA